MSKGISKKEGWLKKEGKRRYFVLVDSNLTWFVQPMVFFKNFFLDFSKILCF